MGKDKKSKIFCSCSGSLNWQKLTLPFIQITTPAATLFQAFPGGGYSNVHCDVHFLEALLLLFSSIHCRALRMRVHLLPLPNAPSAASCQRPASRSSLVICASHFHAGRSTSVATSSELSSSSRRDALLAMGAALSSLVLTGPVRGQEEAQVGGAGTVTSTSSRSPEVRCTPVIYRPLLWRWLVAALPVTGAYSAPLSIFVDAVHYKVCKRSEDSQYSSRSSSLSQMAS